MALDSWQCNWRNRVTFHSSLNTGCNSICGRTRSDLRQVCGHKQGCWDQADSSRETLPGCRTKSTSHQCLHEEQLDMFPWLCLDVAPNAWDARISWTHILEHRPARCRTYVLVCQSARSTLWKGCLDSAMIWFHLWDYPCESKVHFQFSHRCLRDVHLCRYQIFVPCHQDPSLVYSCGCAKDCQFYRRWIGCSCIARALLVRLPRKPHSALATWTLLNQYGSDYYKASNLRDLMVRRATSLRPKAAIVVKSPNVLALLRICSMSRWELQTYSESQYFSNKS